MPELSRFLGIIIRMYCERGVSHNMAHFHVYYKNIDAVFSIEPIEIIAGTLPKRQLRFI